MNIKNNDKIINVRLGSVNCFNYNSIDGMGWFRVFGVGLCWKNTLKYPLLFSERCKHRKGLTLGSYFIKFLKYEKNV